jgi:hypothetical protein
MELAVRLETFEQAGARVLSETRAPEHRARRREYVAVPAAWLWSVFGHGGLLVGEIQADGAGGLGGTRAVLLSPGRELASTHILPNFNVY